MDESSTSSSQKSQEYLEAARRKIGIAEYHLRCLAVEADKGQFRVVTIPIQANFEGILYAFVAATDQTKAAMTLFTRFKVTVANHKEAGDKHSCLLGDSLSRWTGVPIAVDVHKLRNRATHRYYMKVPHGSGLDVQDPFGSDGSPYRGSRDLMSYGKAAVDHLHALGQILDQLEEKLPPGTSQLGDGSLDNRS